MAMVVAVVAGEEEAAAGKAGMEAVGVKAKVAEVAGLAAPEVD